MKNLIGVVFLLLISTACSGFVQPSVKNVTQYAMEVMQDEFGKSIIGDYGVSKGDLIDLKESQILEDYTKDRLDKCGSRYRINGKKYYPIANVSFKVTYENDKQVQTWTRGNETLSMDYKGINVRELSGVMANIFFRPIVENLFGYKFRNISITDIEKGKTVLSETVFIVRGTYEKLLFGTKFSNCNLVLYPKYWHKLKFETNWIDREDRWIVDGSVSIRKSDNTIIRN